MSDARFWNGRRVFVTGPNGFIGAWLIETLLGYGAEVVGLDRAPTGSLDLHPGVRERITLVLGDLTDQPKLEAALDEHQIQTLFHLAGQSSISISRGSPVPAFESNIRGTWCVLDAARSYGKLDTVVVASSLTAYGEQETSPFDESFALNGADPYAAS